ncbi:MAG TPA: NAD(P)H-binding protein [Candidatus Angelobacter sp.]|nr:NAD(P)H-binding protein [Candidatus Angelobacter sp.]
MIITVVGASGLVGARLMELLHAAGHDVVPASRSSGVDAVSAAGLAGALVGARAVIDVTNAPSFEPDAVMAFFTAAAGNTVEAAVAGGIGHYVLLSIVGVDGLPDSPYMRAKVVQERIVAESGLPYSIVRSTQFVEFTEAIVDSLTVGDEVRVPDALIQPIPLDDVATALMSAVASEPINGVMNIGGPEAISFEHMARGVLARQGAGAKTVVVDPEARYFGARLTAHSLVTPD